MRLKSDEIERICRKVLMNWKSQRLITPKTSEDKILKRMVDVFTQNLMAEDKLNAEADQILAKLETQARGQEIDRHKMLMMIRKQLAKEKGFVL